MQQPTMMQSPDETSISMHDEMATALTSLAHAESLWNALYCEALASRLTISAAEQKCLDLLLEHRSRHANPMTPRQVARAINLTPGAVTGVLSRLESAGYVTRKHDLRDRRRILIIINDDRIDADLGPLRRRRELSVRQLCDHFNGPDLQIAADFMQRWTTLLQKETEELRGPTGIAPESNRIDY